MAQPTAVAAQDSKTKLFNDPIHGHIKLHPLCVKIIDTPQFQRLRFIKQLGATDWVYPGAVHSRFEHSLGVYHLAECLITKLRQDQPELDINDRDVLCVKIAALCHDLGHGPFSHLFDQQFIKRKRPGYTWKHEKASTKMFDHLIRKNNIKLAEYGLTKTRGKKGGAGSGENDLEFIKELINPPKPLRSGKWQFKGRKKEKSFLYQIVSNDKNGMDVDKWDYFARDSQHLGLLKGFDHMQLIQHARVINVKGDPKSQVVHGLAPFPPGGSADNDDDDVKGELQICYRDKEWGNVHDMFATRARLHRKAYQHKVKDAVEMMFLDALLEADPILLLEDPRPGKKPKKMSMAIDDMAVYTNLTDQIFLRILYSKEPELENARKILQNIMTRELYRCVAETGPGEWYLFEEFASTPLGLADKIAKSDKSGKIKAEDIGVKMVKVDYGKGDPIKNARFWNKGDPDKAFELKKEDLSQMLPVKFADQFVRVYCKKQGEESFQAVKKCFDEFKKEEGKRRERGEITPKRRSSSPRRSPRLANKSMRRASESKGPHEEVQTDSSLPPGFRPKKLDF